MKLDDKTCETDKIIALCVTVREWCVHSHPVEEELESRGGKVVWENLKTVPPALGALCTHSGPLHVDQPARPAAAVQGPGCWTAPSHRSICAADSLSDLPGFTAERTSPLLSEYR